MGGIILSCEELDDMLCDAGMRMIRTTGGEAGGACREYWYGTGDVAKSGGTSEVITWTEFSGDPACRLHASPYRFASGHEADRLIPQSVYRGYESAAEDCMQWVLGL